MLEVNPPGLLVQLYVCPPVDDVPMVVDEPLHWLVSTPAFGVGNGLTVTIAVSVFVFPVAVIVSVR